MWECSVCVTLMQEHHTWFIIFKPYYLTFFNYLSRFVRSLNSIHQCPHSTPPHKTVCVCFRSPALSSQHYCISSSCLRSRGCFWKAFSSTSCWWRCLRANIHAGDISTWPDMAFLPSLWLFLLQWITAAMGQTECESHTLIWSEWVWMSVCVVAGGLKFSLMLRKLKSE